MSNKILLNHKIYIAGHNGMVGKALLSHLKKLGIKKIITADKKKINLLNANKVKIFLKKKKTRYCNKLCW